jgi:hypothetical protein
MQIVLNLIALALIVFGTISILLADQNGIEGPSDNTSVTTGVICMITGIVYFTFLIARKAISNKS